MTQKGGRKRSTESGAGLDPKGVEKYRRQNPGSKLTRRHHTSLQIEAWFKSAQQT